MQVGSCACKCAKRGDTECPELDSLNHIKMKSVFSKEHSGDRVSPLGPDALCLLSGASALRTGL